MAVNPNWTRDELILALDLYFRIGYQQFHDNNSEVQHLSALLKQLEIHPKSLQQDNFRNPSSVTMKLSNFLAIDPEYPGKGLYATGKLDHVVWNEFSGDRENLRKVADAITAFSEQTSNLLENETQKDAGEEEYPEGEYLTRIHRLRERNHKVVEAKKREVLSKPLGRLICEACDFDFAEVYGAIGHNFIECHHIVPLSELKPNTKTKTSDLAIVCANCHRILHKARPVLTVEQLREIVIGRRKQ